MKRTFPYVAALAFLLAAPVLHAQNADLDTAFQAAKTYELGQDSAMLELLVGQVAAAQRDPALRRDLANRFAALLAPETSPDGWMFACRQLYLIGSEEQLPALAPWLLDPAKSDMARYAVQNMPGEAADRALLDALGKTSGRTRIGIINSLRVRRCAAAVAALTPFLRDTDLEVAKAAALALGDIGGVDAAEQLMLVMIEEVEGLHQTIVDAYLAVAFGELTAGHTDSAREMFRAIHHAPEPKAQIMAAQEGWIAADPASAARLMGLLLTDEDMEMVRQAAHFVRVVPGEDFTRLFVSLLEGSDLGSEPQAILVKALVDRGDRLALPAVTKQIESTNEAVRAAALEGLGVFGDASSVSVLVSTAAGNDGEIRRMARQSLTRLPGEGVDAELMKGLDAEMAEPERLERIRALGERGAKQAADSLLDQARRGSAPVQEAALKAFGEVSGPDRIPDVADLLVGAKEDRVRESAVKTLVVLAQKSAAVEGSASPVVGKLTASSEPAARAALLHVLGEIGDPASLEAIRAALSDPAEEVRYAALSALADWPDAAVLPDLLKVAETSDSARFRSQAVEGYVRLLKLSGDRPAEEMVQAYRHAMDLAPTSAVKRKVLSGLAEIHDRSALAAANEYLNDADVGSEAAIAAERIRSSFYTATASHQTDTAKMALDRSLDTRWTTMAPMQGGEWFLLDMGEQTSVTGVTLDMSTSVKDFPRGYEVYVCADPAAPGQPVATGAGADPILEIKFAPVAGRYVKIVQTGQGDGQWWWSIDELRVLVQ